MINTYTNQYVYCPELGSLTVSVSDIGSTSTSTSSCPIAMDTTNAEPCNNTLVPLPLIQQSYTLPPPKRRYSQAESLDAAVPNQSKRLRIQLYRRGI